MSSAQAVHKKEVLRHEYKDVAAAAANINASDRLLSSSPVFRAVPDRWIVVRLVENAKVSCQTLSSSGQLERDSFEYGDPPPPGIGSKVFVIESNRVRHIEEIPPDDDLLTSTSAYIDPSRPLDEQRKMFLGCSWSLKDWIKDVAPSRSSRYIPLTVVTTGNPILCRLPAA